MLNRLLKNAFPCFGRHDPFAACRRAPNQTRNSLQASGKQTENEHI